jgi:hypothetical protein
VLLIASAVVALIVLGFIVKLRIEDRMNGRALGWMSEQWLIQHRASQSP